MNIFVYGDESGVFDKAHNDIFVFGGLIFLDKNQRDIANRRFIKLEKQIAPSYRSDGSQSVELKACVISNAHRDSLFRATNGCIRYAFVVRQNYVIDEIFQNKKSKQRYLDYVYKVGLKKVFGQLISQGVIDPTDVENLYIRFDEHITATDGRYELREAIEQEFKIGTINFKWNKFHEPIFPAMRGNVFLDFKDSRNDALIRASDIIANRAWRSYKNGREDLVEGKVRVIRFP